MRPDGAVREGNVPLFPPGVPARARQRPGKAERYRSFCRTHACQPVTVGHGTEHGCIADTHGAFRTSSRLDRPRWHPQLDFRWLGQRRPRRRSVKRREGLPACPPLVRALDRRGSGGARAPPPAGLPGSFRSSRHAAFVVVPEARAPGLPRPCQCHAVAARGVGAWRSVSCRPHTGRLSESGPPREEAFGSMGGTSGPVMGIVSDC